MKFIKKYTPIHYNHFSDKAEEYIGEYNDIDKWIKGRNNQTIIKWVRLINLFENNNEEYYEEYCIMLTMMIKFFVIELDIDDDVIKLKNSEIFKISKKFKHAFYSEYAIRSGIKEINPIKHSLL